MNKIEERVNELKKALADYSYHYYVLDSPIVEDAVYDSLFQELKKLESNHPNLITADSPTQRINSIPLDKFTKVNHVFPMISLNDVFSRDDVEAWVKRMDKLIPNSKHEYFCDSKKDGLACSIIYINGKFTQAVTRGDTKIGEDVTHNVKTIKNVPLKLRSNATNQLFLSGRTEVRGEIVMLKSAFEKLNQTRRNSGEAEFANPRNLAAGTIRQLDPKLVSKRPLYFIGYDLLRENADEVPTNMSAYEFMTDLGITRSSEADVFTSLDQVMEYINEWDVKRDSLPYITDGIVIKVNDRKVFSELGVVGKNPRAAVAFKYAAEQATSVVKDIVISIGRTGAATPVAVLNPVVVAGSTVQHASLHNSDEIDRKDVRVGDTVVIYKAGDIIPQVESVILKLRPKNSKKFNFEAELKRQYPELEFERPEGEAVYRAKGLNGPIILKRSLEHYASKGALNIDTLGEKNVEALVDADLVKDISDIYNLNFEQVIKLERFAELSTRNLLEAINNSKQPELPRFIFGLGIRHVGQQTAIDLAEHFTSIEKLADAGIDELLQIEGVGDIVAESIMAWFSDEDNLNLIKKMQNFGVKPRYQSHSKGPLSGISFVVTGSLGSMSRDIVAEKVRRLGGTFQTSVGKGTTYLVSGGNVGASKLKNAEKFGTKVINEDELMKLIG